MFSAFCSRAIAEKQHYLERLNWVIGRVEQSGFLSEGEEEKTWKTERPMETDDERTRVLETDLATTRLRSEQLEAELSKVQSELEKEKKKKSTSIPLPRMPEGGGASSASPRFPGLARESVATEGAGATPAFGSGSAATRFPDGTRPKQRGRAGIQEDPVDPLAKRLESVARMSDDYGGKEEGHFGMDARGSAPGPSRNRQAEERSGMDRGSSRPPARGRTELDATRSRVSLLSSSSKVIKIKITDNSEVISYLDQVIKLEGVIEDLYGEVEEKLKIQIALNQLEGQVRTDGDSIYEECRENGVFCLNSFFKDMFKLAFPAPQSTLDLGFRTLTQGKGSVVEYGRRFKTMIKLMRYEIGGYFYRFIDGLASSELRSALRRQNIEGIVFEELVSLAVAIGNSLSQEKVTEKIFFGESAQDLGRGEDSSQEGGGDMMALVFADPITKYFENAKVKGVHGRCFNCFSKAHKLLECRMKTCKFCGELNSRVKHYSLICPKCPKSLDKFFEVREEAKQEKEKVRHAPEFSAYVFDSDEFSDN